MNYRTKCCGEHHSIKLSKEKDNLSGLIDTYLRDLFDNRNVSPENRKLLYKYYYDTLSKGIDLGYSPTPEMYDPKLAMSLKYDVAKFSAFKETSFKKQLEDLLTKDGKVTSWTDFKKLADVLNVDYNQNWLKTEYDHTVASANMAEKWEDFQADADLYPNLQIVTAGDSRVREEHQILNGFTAPINDSFWATHTTPFDWGCRCDIIQTDDKASDKVPDYNFKSGFENNPALSGKIFGEIPYADGLSSSEEKEATTFANQNFENDSFEKITLESFENGGEINSSNLVDSSAKDYEDVYNCCKNFAENGDITEVLSPIEFDSPLYKEIYEDLIGTIYERKCPDFMVNGVFYELEGFDGKGYYSNMLKRGLKQSSRVIIAKTDETESYLKKLIKFSIFEGKKIDEVWILDKGKISLFYPH